MTYAPLPNTPEDIDALVADFAALLSDSPSAPTADAADSASLRARAAAPAPADPAAIEGLAMKLYDSMCDELDWIDIQANERRYYRNMARTVASAGWAPSTAASPFPSAEQRDSLAVHLFTQYNSEAWAQQNDAVRRSYRMIAAEIERLDWAPLVVAVEQVAA